MSDCDCHCGDCGDCSWDCDCTDCNMSCPPCFSSCQGFEECCANLSGHGPCCRVAQCCCDTNSNLHNQHCSLSGCCSCCCSDSGAQQSQSSWWWWCYWCDTDPLYYSSSNNSSPSVSQKYSDAQRREAIRLMIARDLNTLKSSTLPSFQWSKRDYEGLRLGDGGLRLLFDELSRGVLSNGEQQGALLYSPSSYAAAPSATTSCGPYTFVSRIEFQDHSLTDSSVSEVLAQLVLRFFPDIAVINISRNNIAAGGAASVAQVLRSPMCRIKAVSITGNPLSAAGFADVVCAATACSPLERLEIGDVDTSDAPNYLGEGGLPTNAAVEALIGLIRSSATVQSLRLVGPFAWMGTFHFSQIVSALAAASSVTELDLHECLLKEICEGPGVQAIMFTPLEAVLCCNTCPLRKLVVRCQLADDAAAQISRAVASAVALESLCLSRCGLSSRALCLFGEALAVNRSLLSLDLSYPGATVPGSLASLTTALARQNRVLREVNVVGAEITVQDICELQHGIEALENTSLLTVRHNPCEGDERLHQLLEGNARLHARLEQPRPPPPPTLAAAESVDQRGTVVPVAGDDDEIVDSSAVVAELDGEDNGHIPPCGDCPFQPDRV